MKTLFFLACVFGLAKTQAQTGGATVGAGSQVATPVFITPSSIGTTPSVICSPFCNIGKPSIFIQDVTVNEPEGVAYVKVSLGRSSSETVSVKYSTKNGSAKHPKDYDKTTGTLIFNANEAFKTIAVAIVVDDKSEDDEDFFMELSHAENAVIADASATVTIKDVATASRGINPTPELQFSIAAAPNPSANSFNLTVTTNASEKINITVFDNVGRKVKDYELVKAGSIVIGENLVAGVYTVQVTQGKNKETVRLMKL